MRKSELILANIAEVARIWGEDGFDGDAGDYRWLQDNYGIGEMDDVHWQLILEHDAGELSEEDLEDQEPMAFLDEPRCSRSVAPR